MSDYRDFDEIMPGVYVGAFPAPGEVPHFIDGVVFAAAEHQPSPSQIKDAYRGLDVIKVPLNDSKLSDSMQSAAWTAARAVARRVQAGKKMLVTCHAGVNRSALIAGLAITLLTGRPGWYAANLILARRRPHTDWKPLCNTSFQMYLRTIPAMQ